MPEIPATIAATIAAIRAPDRGVAAAADRRQRELIKPPGSLGRLEALATQVCAVQRTLTPSVARRAVVVFAADHGVADEGVSAYPREVTAQMVANFAAGGAAICALSRAAGAALVVVDVGVATPCPGVIARRVRAGTANFARGPAMTRDEARRAIEVGIAIAGELDADLLGVGEMGIGNTTSAAAIAAVLCGLPAAAVTGTGTGIDAATLARKRAVVDAALAAHRPDPRDALGVLAAVGGLEIAAIAGACLGAAARGALVVLDGFISTAGGALAAVLAPAVVGSLIAAHRSVEPGHAALLDQLGLAPLLELELRLGEATGAALAMPLIGGAVAAFREMATFASAGVAGPS
jgi:nicotinate-nucleotide--dimethylbenzimidazole phosphoribosyltransferase